jgi:Protein of unknown function (DUF1552)
MPNFDFQKRLRRRTLLRGAGVSMSLPYLTSMSPAWSAEPEQPPHRFIAFTLGLGLIPDNLYPKESGRQYEPTHYLKPLADLQDKFTVISGASHPGVKGGHRAEASILTAAPMRTAGGSANTISVDQLLSKHFGHNTRFPSLVLSVDGNTSPCYTESGAMIPPISQATELFDLLFVDGDAKTREKNAKSVARGRSIMDLVGEDARSLQRELGQVDRARLDAYFTSVRDLEKRMEQSEFWAQRPKPSVDLKRPQEIRDRSDFVARWRLMADLMKLAIQTDSSRYLTLHLNGGNHKLPIDGVTNGYHTLSHHGQDEDKLEQLKLVETAIVSAFGDFLRLLASTEEGGSSLLDQTSVLLTSNLGNASSHDNRNMPVLFGGGGFKHAGHLAFDRKNNYPLPNLFVSILQKSGLAVDRFATSTGTMDGLG